MNSVKKTFNKNGSLIKNENRLHSSNLKNNNESNNNNGGDEEDDSVWICPICSVAYVDGAADMVGCDSCDRWFHWYLFFFFKLKQRKMIKNIFYRHCVGILIAPPENIQWYCNSCQKKRKKVDIKETATKTIIKKKK